MLNKPVGSNPIASMGVTNNALPTGGPLNPGIFDNPQRRPWKQPPVAFEVNLLENTLASSATNVPRTPHFSSRYKLGQKPSFSFPNLLETTLASGAPAPVPFTNNVLDFQSRSSRQNLSSFPNLLETTLAIGTPVEVPFTNNVLDFNKRVASRQDSTFLNLLGTTLATQVPITPPIQDIPRRVRGNVAHTFPNLLGSTLATNPIPTQPQFLTNAGRPVRSPGFEFQNLLETTLYPTNDVTISATKDTLTITEYPATVRLDVTINATVDNLIITERPATDSYTYVVNANFDVILINERRASVNNSDAGLESLSQRRRLYALNKRRKTTGDI